MTNEKVAGDAPVAAEPETRKKREYKDMEHGEKQENLHAKVDMSTIQFTAADLYDKDKVDIEHIVMEDVLTLLQCDEGGLTEAEAHNRIGIFGPNKLEEKSENAFLQFLSFMWNPLSWVMEGAAIVAIAFSNGGGEPPDWQDFVGIVLLLFINSTIGFVEERNAGNAVKALMESLAPKARVKRDGAWKEIDSADLVPGDLVAFKHGDICPADCRLVESVDVSMDQAALTGESLPQGKKLGDECFSGSTCKQGEAEGIVISTGPNTFFGRAATLVGQDNDQTGHLQMVLAQIGSFCLISIGIFVLLEILVLYADYRYAYRRGLNNILVLLIGGIPIAMPTVLSVTLAVGAQQLAKHKAIVTRITAIEELAGVTILCSDKTVPSQPTSSPSTRRTSSATPSGMLRVFVSLLPTLPEPRTRMLSMVVLLVLYPTPSRREKVSISSTSSLSTLSTSELKSPTETTEMVASSSEPPRV